MNPDKKSLHVALLTYRGNMFCGGQGVYAANLAGALAARGHRVSLFSGPPYPEVPEGVRLFKVAGYNFVNRPAGWLPPEEPWKVFRPLMFLEYAFARAGNNPEALAFSLRVFREIQKLHQREPVDVVHDNQGLGYGLLFFKAMGLPLVGTIHHPLQVDRAEDIRQSRGLSGKVQRALYYPIFMHRFMAGRLDRALMVSEFSRSLILDTYRLTREKTAVVHNGIDPAVFRPLEHVKREPGRLLFVGSTEDRKKGIIYLLQALSRLPGRFRLVVVDGRMYPGRVYAKNAVARLGLKNRVEFRGGLRGQELVLEYNRAEMAVVPSLFEGFGLPALEAMATGTPLICTTAGALPEVTGRESAVLIPPRSARAIQEAVLRLDRDEEKRGRMARRARERAVRVFSWQRAAELTELEYRKAMASTRARKKAVPRAGAAAAGLQRVIG